jgi:hypothetical protein
MAAWVRATRRCDREPCRGGGAELLGMSSTTQRVDVFPWGAAAACAVTCSGIFNQDISVVLIDPRHYG